MDILYDPGSTVQVPGNQLKTFYNLITSVTKLLYWLTFLLTLTCPLLIAVLAPQPSEGDAADDEWREGARDTEDQTLAHLHSEISFSSRTSEGTCKQLSTARNLPF